MKKKYVLFVGRYQPFHLGHKTLMEVALNEGKNVLIALMDLDISDRNPYTYEERVEKISKDMQEYGNRVKIIKIDPIEEICWGRNVGWTPRRIHLDKEIEAITATLIRENIKINKNKI